MKCALALLVVSCVAGFSHATTRWTFACPESWASRKESEERSICESPAEDGRSPVVISVERLDDITPRLLVPSIRNRGEKVVKEGAFSGRKATISVADNVTAIYIPDRGDFVRLGYSGDSGESFNEFMEAYLEFLKSFHFNIPCECSDEMQSAGIDLAKLKGNGSLDVAKAYELLPFDNFLASESQGKVPTTSRAVVYPQGGKCLLVVLITNPALSKRGKFIEVHYSTRGRNLLSTDVKMIGVRGGVRKNQVRTSLDFARQSTSYVEYTPSSGTLFIQKLEPWVGPLADNRGFVIADFGGDLGRVRIAYDVTGAEMR